MGWYSDIAKDINNIPKAIQYFEDELIEAKSQIRIKGCLLYTSPSPRD